MGRTLLVVSYSYFIRTIHDRKAEQIYSKFCLMPRERSLDPCIDYVKDITLLEVAPMSPRLRRRMMQGGLVGLDVPRTLSASRPRPILGQAQES